MHTQNVWLQNFLMSRIDNLEKKKRKEKKIGEPIDYTKKNTQKCIYNFFVSESSLFLTKL